MNTTLVVNMLARKLKIIFVVSATLYLSAYAHSESTIDSLEFSSSGESIWGPQSGALEALSFRHKIVDIDTSGTLGDFLGVDIASQAAMPEGSTQFLCPQGAFLDIVTGDCYSCPGGYTHNSSLSAGQVGVCSRISNFTTADRAGGAQFVCPAGQFPDALLQNCYSCPSGTSQDPLIPAGLSGSCKANTTADREPGNALFCDAGDFYNGSLTACYDCSSGYTHNPALGVNTRGVCWKVGTRTEYTPRVCVWWNVEGKCTERIGGDPYSVPYTSYRTANYQYDLGCDGGEFISGNSCYSCPSGTSHNPLLPVSVPGVCYSNASAQQEAPTTFICNSGEFLDAETGACFTCPTGYLHNPALFASTEGVCFEKDDTIAQQDGETGLICPFGQFLDVVSGECYSCAEGYTWNPSASVESNNACVNWDSLNVGDIDNPAFEVGYAIDYDVLHVEGIEGGITTDPGSIDINFTPSVEIDIQAKTSVDGNEHLLISTRQLSDAEDLNMSTTWPGVEMYLDTFTEREYYAEGEFRNVEFEAPLWQQKSRTSTLFDWSTDGEQHPDDDDPLLLFGLGASGLDLQVVGKGLENYTGGLDPGAELTQNFFKKVNPGVPVLGTPIVEFGITGPKMNTPPERTTDILDRDINYKADFEEEVSLGQNATNTSIVQSIFSSDRSGARIGILGGSAQETDVLRLDLDVDGMTSFLTTQGSVALGYKLSIPTGIPLIDFLSVSSSILDADIATIFSFQETLNFRPNLNVIVSFSVPVLLEVSPGEGFERLSEIQLPVGDAVEIIHPGGELIIGTRYTLSENVFESDIDLMLTPIVEMEILSSQVKILGVPQSLLPKFTAVKLTQEGVAEPVKLVDMNYHDDIPPYGFWEAVTPGLDGLSDAQKHQRYDEYVRDEINVASFSLRGFSDVQGGQFSIIGNHDQPVARCQDAGLLLDAAGLAVLSVPDVDDGSSDFDGGALVSLALSQTQFSCADIGLQPVMLSVVDGAGAGASCQASVSASDMLAPVGSLPNQLTLAEGEIVQFSDSISDNCGAIDFDWVFPNGEHSDLSAPEHAFCVLGSQQILFQADDGQGNVRDEVIPVTVANVAPVAEAGVEINGFEGQAVSLLEAYFSDSGLFGHQVLINWGDGSGVETVDLVTPDFGVQCLVKMDVIPEHIYVQNGDYTITLLVRDAAGATHEDTTLAHIANRDPVIDELELAGRPETDFDNGLFIYSGDSLEFALQYSDEGVDDAHQLRIDWKEHGVATSLYDLDITASNAGQFSEQHIFYKPGRYMLHFTLEDGEGGQDVREITFQVKPLTVSMDFMPLDPENLVSDGLSGPIRTTIFSGEHELGPFDVHEIDVDTLVLGQGNAQALHKIYDLVVLEFQGNVIAEYEDFNQDQIDDLKIWFDAEDLGLTAEHRSIKLAGRFIDGRYFEARDRLNTAAARAEFIRIMSAIQLLLTH